MIPFERRTILCTKTMKTIHKNTNTTENNNGYHEYYYSSSQTINTSPTPPSQNNKKKSGRGKKAVTVVCLGLVFGVTAGADSVCQSPSQTKS